MSLIGDPVVIHTSLVLYISTVDRLLECLAQLWHSATRGRLCLFSSRDCAGAATNWIGLRSIPANLSSTRPPLIGRALRAVSSHLGKILSPPTAASFIISRCRLLILIAHPGQAHRTPCYRSMAPTLAKRSVVLIRSPVLWPLLLITAFEACLCPNATGSVCAH